jgi:hypothetical protein
MKLLIEPSPSKISVSILNFIKIRWQITEILGSKFLAETACIRCIYNASVNYNT